MLNCIGFIRIVPHSGYDVNAFSRFNLDFQRVSCGFVCAGNAAAAAFARLFSACGASCRLQKQHNPTFLIVKADRDCAICPHMNKSRRAEKISPRGVKIQCFCTALMMRAIAALSTALMPSSTKKLMPMTVTKSTVTTLPVQP